MTLLAALTGTAMMLNRDRASPEPRADREPPVARAPSAHEAARAPRPVERILPARPERAASSRQPFVVKKPLAHVFEQTPEQKRLLYDAREMVVASCMKERGFDYEPVPYVEDSERRSTPRYQHGNLEIASAAGYGIADSVELGNSELPVNPNERIVQKLEPNAQRAWDTALRGDTSKKPDIEEVKRKKSMGVATGTDGSAIVWDRDSCLTRAQREIQGDDQKVMQLIFDAHAAANEVYRKTEADDSYRTALARWRRCMEREGLPYERPGSAAEALGRDFREGRIAPRDLRMREIEVASADSSCYLEAELGEARAEAQARAEQEVTEERGDTLTAYQDMQTSSLERARAKLER